MGENRKTFLPEYFTLAPHVFEVTNGETLSSLWWCLRERHDRSTVMAAMEHRSHTGVLPGMVLRLGALFHILFMAIQYVHAGIYADLSVMIMMP